MPSSLKPKSLTLAKDKVLKYLSFQSSPSFPSAWKMKHSFSLRPPLAIQVDLGPFAPSSAYFQNCKSREGRDCVFLPEVLTNYMIGE